MESWPAHARHPGGSSGGNGDNDGPSTKTATGLAIVLAATAGADPADDVTAVSRGDIAVYYTVYLRSSGVVALTPAQLGAFESGALYSKRTCARSPGRYFPYAAR